MAGWLVSSEEMRQLDRQVIEQIGVPGVVLMDAAGRGVADLIVRIVDVPRARVVVNATGPWSPCRRIGPVGLVVGIHLGAERLLRPVEHDREMGRLFPRRHVAQQLPQHVAEAEHGVDLQAVGLAGQRRQRVVGAENVAGAVDQKDVVALLELGGRRGGRSFGHGRLSCKSESPD